MSLLKRYREQVYLLSRIADGVLCVFAFWLAFALRTSFFGQEGALGPLDSHLWILSASLVLHFILYPYFGFYAPLRRRRSWEIARDVAQAFLIEFFVLGGLVFLLQAKETSRYFFGLFLFLNYALVLFVRWGGRALLTRIRRRGYNYRTVLILGTGRTARQVLETLKRNTDWGQLPIGLVAEVGAPVEEVIFGIPVLGTVADLDRIVRQFAIDEALFAPDVFELEKLNEAMLLFENLGIPSRLALGLSTPNSKITTTEMDGIPLITFYTTLMTPLEATLKRTLDLAAAVVGLGVTLILLPWIAYRIRRDSPGPVFFKQIRVGQNGRKFKCYKFRTMYADAESRRAQLEAANQMSGPLFKMKEDPRVTPFGAFLRRTSLDEFPQFMNILRGDMSLVGTRPPTLDEVEKYRLGDRRRLSIRPGLTGLWQVSGRNEIQDFDDVIKLDLRYIDHWSIWMDLWIVFRTVGVALFRKGAY